MLLRVGERERQFLYIIEKSINRHKSGICKDLPGLYLNLSGRNRFPPSGIFRAALRLIRPCLKLFVSACFFSPKGCAISFRTEILCVRAEKIRRRISVYAP